MDRRERGNSQQAGILAALGGLQAGIWTALPGIIQSFNAAAMTAQIQPAIMAQVQNPDGSKKWVQLPLLVDCPVFFPSGGGVSLTFPIKPEDECLVIFSSRCIDGWWQSGGVNVQAELRMHDLSDGFAFVGIRSIPHVISDISNTDAQLRTDDGTSVVSVGPSGVSVDAPVINLNGSLFINGQAYVDHIHSGVLPGPSNTGGVVT